MALRLFCKFMDGNRNTVCVMINIYLFHYTFSGQPHFSAAPPSLTLNHQLWLEMLHLLAGEK